MSARPSAFLLLVWTFSLASPAAEPNAEVLWTGNDGPCRIRLESPSGDLEVALVSGPPRLLGAAGAWRSQAGERDGATHLVASPQTPAASALRLEVPPLCQLIVVTQRGNIEAAGLFASPLELETNSGNITLRVPAASNLAVELATSGEITVDFSVSIDYRHHQEPSKQGRIVLGSAAGSVRLSSNTGSIRVLKLNE